jgi:hypothetical protein
VPNRRSAAPGGWRAGPANPAANRSRADLGGATLSIVRVRGRAIGGAVLAVALVVAVVSLRGQVEAPGSGPPAQPMPPTTTPSPRTLPVLPAERATQWRTYKLPAGTMTARADPEHIVMTGIAEPDDPRSAEMLTVWSRDGSRQEFGYRPQPGSWATVDWQILDGALYVVEIPMDGGDLRSGARLTRVDLGSGRVEQIPVRSVQPLWPSMFAVGNELIGAGRRYLLTLGDELIVTGISAKNPAEQCAIAIRPSTRVERTIGCGVGPPIIEPADGGVFIRLPDNSPDGCAARLLMPGRGAFGLPVFSGDCRQRQVIPLGGWQAYLINGADPAQPLLATNGSDRVMLGTAALVVFCHGRLYWVSGGHKEWPVGTEVLRWTPGASEVEVVHRSQGETWFGWPMCVDGTLGVQAYPSPPDPQPPDLLVLDRP